MQGPERERLQHLVAALGEGGTRVRAEGLRGSSRAYLLARVLSALRRPALVLTSTLAEARTFAAELSFFTGADREPFTSPENLKVALFPPWDASPFEVIPPLPDVSARRIASLYRARCPGPFALVAPVAAALQRT